MLRPVMSKNNDLRHALMVRRLMIPENRMEKGIWVLEKQAHERKSGRVKAIRTN